MHNRRANQAAHLRSVVLLVIGMITLCSAGALLGQIRASDILFMSDRDGNRDIYVMDADDNSIERITFDHGEDTEPSWSPDRRQIVFSSNREGEFAVFIMNTDGSNPHRISPDIGSYAGSPAWSPDGQNIVYVSNAEGNSQIRIVSIDGSDDQAVTSGSYESIDPTWSSDGEMITFAANPNGNFEIFAIRRDGTGLRQLTNDPNMDSDSPAWSPNGTLIVFAANSAHLGELYVMNPNGSDVRLLVSTENEIIASPTWSPDGEAIVYSVRSSAHRSLQRVNEDGFGLELLNTGADNADFPSWAAPVQAASTYSIVGTAVPLNRPLPITVARPRSVQQGLNYTSVWSAIEFQDIASPGIATYELVVDAAQTYRWVFTWCGSDTVSLDAVLQPLASIEFRVDGSPIDSVLEYSVPDCRGWITLLSNWPTDQPVTLEVVYVLSDELFDGIKHYDPGQYVQQIVVTAR